MFCPNCKNTELRAKQYKQAQLDYCPQCKGIWFDRKELARCIKEIASEGLTVPGDSEPAARACPKCFLQMQKFYYPQTYCEIDMCEKCLGIWLDDQELKEIYTVRTALKKQNKLETVAPPTGIKGQIIDMINKAIEKLSEVNFE